MSDALNYLMKVRPEAMQSYFDFIKKSGTHLDKKTRALISVITKVENQTETGFRQYLSRALQAGATADEIIDALFAAFPILGLSKIIWAVDIIIALDIPEFRPEALGSQSTWHQIIPVDDIIEGTTRIKCDDREIFIYRKKDLINVYDSRCPHQVTNIPYLALTEHILTCPKHHWKFDITTGECIENGDRPLRKYETRIKKGLLEVYW
jgi:nitrite reductase/ring-hydroxylating ferredoxin subunit/alkylhydroperoxidase/carboxymuconolactone decarboxylase family protein YurZ